MGVMIKGNVMNSFSPLWQGAELTIYPVSLPLFAINQPKVLCEVGWIYLNEKLAEDMILWLEGLELTRS